MSGADWSGRRLHFVGIGGAGMSGLALIAHRLGAAVTGSDHNDTPYLIELRSLGLVPSVGPYAAEHVPDGAEIVYSTAVGRDNPERQAGRTAGAPELHRSELLAQIAALRRCLAVTGTHGKTTTAAMIVHALQGCGLDPSYVVGGELRSTESNAGWGGGEWIVIEADESDRSLLHLDPEIALLTNAELDHHTTYASQQDLEDTFREFLGRAAVDVVWDRPQLVGLCTASRVEPYDVRDAELSPEGSQFRWRDLTVRLSVPGQHYAVNAAGALTAAALTGADPELAVRALASFQGTKRRLELLGQTDAGVAVYDSYAHHPTEIAADLAALRTLEAERVVAAFQPHLYSRTRVLGREFGTALAAADVVVVLDVYPARERV
ncbi:MAG TPA: UDP-N-acetylmuramate--L-alanine ligase, partial [Solirubrobacteraceae bacterium]|nr:UDP-N-acetylmuramate--L-alanine ligase [Solirubrobacteraceae bacterium]